ncbi:unnamed protein product [Caenorhabditis bovis]|uniref:Translocation protein SEC62 n=1 Tax=Caenorhabditis bovis TaxID=2654633 RepID=A0A8S1EWW2_9PELO|nr:unnamed protein product [Caenorhabditis bovis]
MSKRRDKGNSSNSEDEALKLSKKEEEIAKYVRFNCPTSTTIFEGNEVHYFSGCKAVDTLWESKYGSKNTKNPMFKTRDECYHYIADLFPKQLFFRAKKLVPKKKDDKEKGTDSAADAPKSPKKSAEKRKDKKTVKEEDTAAETENEDKKKEENKKEQTEEEKKKKKKVKLLIHPTQVFCDDKDVYVWVYDPTPLYKKIIGVLMLLGTIVGCLFPLWPMWLRQGVYYVSLTGIGLFASIIVVAILRTILFGIIYAVTLGKHKLWILPNLTEDCGVLESFQPWYTYEYCPGDKDSKSDKKKDKKKSKKDKDSDAEQDDDQEPLVKNEKDGEEDDEDAEKYSQASTDENYEKIDGEDVSSAPSSPAENPVRKRRPAKV